MKSSSILPCHPFARFLALAAMVSVIHARSRSVSKTFTVGKGPNGVTFRAATDRRASVATSRLGEQAQ